jgi:hypothetical protein
MHMEACVSVRTGERSWCVHDDSFVGVSTGAFERPGALRPTLRIDRAKFAIEHYADGAISSTQLQALDDPVG